MIIMPIIKLTVMNSNDSTKPRVLIHCQYVYGIGHLVRTIELAKGLSSEFEVFVLNGGEQVSNFEIPKTVTVIQLPAIYKEESQSKLTPIDSSITLHECFKKRSEKIYASIKKMTPDLIITEHFPFGLLFEKEVVKLIQFGKKHNPSVKLVCSVRDIIESSKGSENDDHICELINQFYDMVLIHGDHKIIPFRSSFPMQDRISTPIIQTGYIARSLNIQPIVAIREEAPIMLVSVAGGRVGGELLEAVLNAHHRIKEKWNHKLVLFSGAFQNEEETLKHRIKKEYTDSVVYYDFSDKLYLKYLYASSMVICLGGYNSLIESVSLGKPVMVYRREFLGSNMEQDLRINLFHKAGYVEVINPNDLEIEKLVELTIKTLKNFKYPNQKINTSGVKNSTEVLLSMFK